MANRPRRREDHLVEPLFEGLRASHGGEPAQVETRGRARVIWAAGIACAVIVTLALILWI